MDATNTGTTQNSGKLLNDFLSSQPVNNNVQTAVSNASSKGSSALNKNRLLSASKKLSQPGLPTMPDQK